MTPLSPRSAAVVYVGASVIWAALFGAEPFVCAEGVMAAAVGACGNALLSIVAEDSAVYFLVLLATVLLSMLAMYLYYGLAFGSLVLAVLESGSLGYPKRLYRTAHVVAVTAFLIVIGLASASVRSATDLDAARIKLLWALIPFLVGAFAVYDIFARRARTA